jgi:hypothetical protein
MASENKLSPDPGALKPGQGVSFATVDALA